MTRKRNVELENLLRVFGETEEEETAFSRINLRPLEIAADTTMAIATLGASIILKRMFRF